MPVGEIHQQPQTLCESVQRLGLNPKGLPMSNSPSPSLARLPREDREAELDSGQI